MNNNDVKVFGHSTLAITLLAFIGLLLLGGVDSTQAQWATSGTNINNTNTGNVGVGTTTPGAKLDVVRGDGSDLLLRAWNSSTSSGNAIFRAAASSGGSEAARLEFTNNTGFNGGVSADNTNGLIFRTGNQTGTYGAMGLRMTITTGGNVGIGTASPGEKLVTFGNLLAGNIANHTQLFSTYDSQSPVIMELGYGTATANITPFPNLVLSKNLTSTSNVVGLISFANSSIANGSEKRVSGIGSWTDGATNSGALLFYTSSAGNFSERMRVTSAGNVGIGTSSPNARLVIPSGNVGLGSNDIENWTQASSVIESLNSSLYFGQVTDIHLLSNAYLNGAWKYKGSGPASDHFLYNGTHGFRVASSGATDAAVTWTDAMTINNAANVGIGTTTPNYRVDVQGGQINASGGLCISGVCKNAWSEVGSQWATSGTTINYGTGNVGIGTSTPAYTFDVRSSSTLIGRFASSASGHNQVLFDAPAGFNSNLTLQQGGVSKWYLGNRASNNRFSLIESTGLVETFSVLQNGNVGIGTSAPTTTLHVVGAGTITGDLTVGGNLAAKYQDVAEWVESSQSLKAGTVVVLDHTRSNQVIASSQAYDTRVAGVISLQPGLTLGVPGTSKVLVATTGRVRIKVDASSGPIHIGDLLVTGDKEGVAMKSQPISIGDVHLHRPGTLIGKALESLESGTGEILVLLSLQ